MLGCMTLDSNWFLRRRGSCDVNQITSETPSALSERMRHFIEQHCIYRRGHCEVDTLTSLMDLRSLAIIFRTLDSLLRACSASCCLEAASIWKLDTSCKETEQYQSTAPRYFIGCIKQGAIIGTQIGVKGWKMRAECFKEGVVVKIIGWEL